SQTALHRGHALHPRIYFIHADALRLPLPDNSVDLLLDRGLFHYIPAEERPRYVDEATRVLRPGGRLLLRACMPHGDMPQDMSQPILERLFDGWDIHSMRDRAIRVDTGTLRALEVRLQLPQSYLM
ncbi:MAG: class I SAM-dependent methyltransferase, partial [Actinomycetota bacterium]|nr:class I SAM-dependent methyltransferase [Actinomycetota bacterium]